MKTSTLFRAFEKAHGEAWYYWHKFMTGMDEVRDIYFKRDRQSSVFEKRILARLEAKDD